MSKKLINPPTKYDNLLDVPEFFTAKPKKFGWFETPDTSQFKLTVVRRMPEDPGGNPSKNR